MTKKTNCQSQGLDGLYDGLRRPGIMRSSDEKWFAGVCTGVARWLGVDPLVVRGAFILLAIFFGMGVALYLVLWLLMPTEGGEISIERALKYGDGGSIFLLVITVMSVLGGGPWFGDGGFRGVRIGGIAVVAVLAWWFLTRTDAGRGLVASSPWARNGSDGPASGVDAGMPATSGPAPAPSSGLSTGNAAAAAGAAVTNPLTNPLANTLKKTPAPTPTRPRVRTIGFAAMLVVLGAAIGAGALLGSLAQHGSWAGNHLAIGVAAGLAVVGLALVIAGIAGRRSGVLSPIAGFAMAFLAFTSVVPAGINQPWDVGDRAVSVTSLSATNAYQLGVGQLTVDLTKADYASTPAKPDLVTASLGVGQLDVIIPTGTSVVVNTKGRLGEAAVFTPADAKANNDKAGTQSADGANWSRTYTFGSGKPELTIDAEVGLGQIRVITGATP